MSPQDGRGLNCWFPMPFREGARLEITNDGSSAARFYYYIDYELVDSLDEDVGYFHSQWHRESTAGWADPKTPVMEERACCPDYPDWYPKAWTVPNTSGQGNYIILEAEGRGQYVGCNLNIDCISRQARVEMEGEEFSISLPYPRSDLIPPFHQSYYRAWTCQWSVE